MWKLTLVVRKIEQINGKSSIVKQIVLYLTPISIIRDEYDLVAFIKDKLGTGYYSVVSRGRSKKNKGFFKFWRGYITKDGFQRIEGSITPYLKSALPTGAWHKLKEVKRNG